MTTVALFMSLLSAGFSCVTYTDKPQVEIKEAEEDLNVAKQNEQALALFQKIYETTEQNDRNSIIPQLESMYLDIINKFPKAALAQEAYWRILLIYLNDYNPPAYDKLESTYAKFIEKYPDSPFRSEIEDNISKMYYRKAKWDSLMRFYTPAVKNYIAIGKLNRAQEIFLYSEAKINLGDLAEAEKGFKIVIAHFPDTREASLARQRLAAIANMKSKQN
jgi:tetratricopeptide (TPR) repeat protein